MENNKIHEAKSLQDLVNYVIENSPLQSAYQIEVKIIGGQSNATGEIEGCKRIYQLLSENKIVAELQESGIRYDNKKEIEENRKESIIDLLIAIDKEIKDKFSQGIKIDDDCKFSLPSKEIKK